MDKGAAAKNIMAAMVSITIATAVHHARITLRHQSSSVHALLVKGWREGSDGSTSNLPHGGKG